MERLPGEPLCVLVVRQQLRQLVAEDRDAARLEPDDRDARRGSRGAGRSARARGSGGPGRGSRSRRAGGRSRGGRGGSETREAGALEHPDGRGSDVRLEMVRERVGPEDDVAAHRPQTARARRTRRRTCAAAKRRQLAAAATRLPATFAAAARPGVCVTRFATPAARARRAAPSGRSARRRRRAAAAPAARSGARGTRPSASACRRSTGQSCVQPLHDRQRSSASSTSAERHSSSSLAVQHLPEQVRPAAGRVLLLAGDHVARAHHPALRAAAVADADAADGRVGEAAAVARVGEVRLQPRRAGSPGRGAGSRRSDTGRRPCPGSSSSRDPRSP